MILIFLFFSAQSLSNYVSLCYVCPGTKVFASTPTRPFSPWPTVNGSSCSTSRPATSTASWIFRVTWSGPKVGCLVSWFITWRYFQNGCSFLAFLILKMSFLYNQLKEISKVVPFPLAQPSLIIWELCFYCNSLFENWEFHRRGPFDSCHFW